jgi:hypothetical protein
VNEQNKKNDNTVGYPVGETTTQKQLVLQEIIEINEKQLLILNFMRLH